MSDIKSKEEMAAIEVKFKIVEKFYSTRLNPPLRYDSDKIPLYVAFPAMAEYAKQQSIEFGKWASKEGWQTNGDDVWENWNHEDQQITESLYELFIDHQLKQQV